MCATLSKKMSATLSSSVSIRACVSVMSKTCGMAASTMPTDCCHLSRTRPRVTLKPEDSGKGKEDLIFDLPTYESCCKSVRRWVKRAGIDKHISWHCARHSFAVNILNNGANIKTVASLLGHSGLKHTEKYTRAVDKLKENAINSLPELKL